MKLTATEFTTSYPDDWQDRTMITIVAPFAPGEFAANCVVTKHFVAAHDSLEDFVREQLKLMEQSLRNFEVLDYRVNTVNGFPACQQLHRFQTENGFLQQVQTFVLANLKVYVITGTSTVAAFDRHINAFREIVENFEISET
jgi:hypothetical protein